MNLVRHPTDGRVHFSELKSMARSPRHYVNACSEARSVTRPMTVGSVADCLVFGHRGWAIYPGKVRNGREWEAWRKEYTGLVQCIQSEYDDAEVIAEAIRKDAVARILLTGCEYQRVGQWSAYGLECAAGIKGERGGFDAINLKGCELTGGMPYILDLKATASAEPSELAKHAWRMLWHCQGAWYVDGAEAMGLPFGRGTVRNVGGESVEEPVCDFIILAAEVGSGCVTAMPVSATALDHGRRSITMWAERLRACDKTGHFPGYVDGRMAEEMTVPEWES